MTDRIVLVDIETTGLDHMTDVILEVGVQIREADLTLVDEFDVQVWDTPYYDKKYDELQVRAAAGEKGPSIVMDMHTKNGLWENAQADGLTPTDAEREIVEFLKGHGVHTYKPPIAGSSVHFDRTFLYEAMPGIVECFGHRNLDISSIKEACKLMNPELYKRLEKFGPPKKETHRVLGDLTDTSNEFAFYAQEFLIVDMDVKYS